VLTATNTAQNAPSNSSTYYLGGDVADSNNTTFDVAKIEVPKNGTIKRIFVRQIIVAGIVASAEGVTHKVCINSGTNCFGGATFSYNGLSTSGSDITLNQPVAAGDNAGDPSGYTELGNTSDQLALVRDGVHRVVRQGGRTSVLLYLLESS
jgi:hypothetical protein